MQVDSKLNVEILPAPENFKKIRHTEPEYYENASFIYASMIMQPPEQRTIRKIKMTDRVTAADGKILLPKGYFPSAPTWRISNQLYEDYDTEGSILSFSSDYEISLLDIKNEIERHYARSGLFFYPYVIVVW